MILTELVQPANEMMVVAVQKSKTGPDGPESYNHAKRQHRHEGRGVLWSDLTRTWTNELDVAPI